MDGVHRQAGHVATLADDREVQFAPQRMTGQDAKVAADISEHGADRPAADFDVNLFRGGRAGEKCGVVIGARGGGTLARCVRFRSCGGRLARAGLPRCVETRGVAEQACLEGVCPQQTAGDAGKDQGEVGSAEGAGGDGGLRTQAVFAERGGEFAAVVDQLADEGEQASGAAGRWCGVCRRGGHWGKRSIGQSSVSRNIFT